MRRFFYFSRPLLLCCILFVGCSGEEGETPSHSREKISTSQATHSAAYSTQGDLFFYKNKRLPFTEGALIPLGTGSLYAKAGDTVFYQATPIPQADAASFMEIAGAATYPPTPIFDPLGRNQPEYGGGYAKDAHHVFAQNTLLTTADTATFVVLDNANGYAKDAQAVWLGTHKIQNADPNTFTLYTLPTLKKGQKTYIPSWQTVRYSHDASTVYYGLYRLPLAVPNLFQVLDEQGIFATDGDRIYVQGTVLFEASPSTFKTLGGGFATDGFTVWFREHVLEKADAASFTPLEGVFAKDSRGIWGANKFLAGADAATFTFTPGNDYAQDATTLWLGISQPAIPCDTKTFVPLPVPVAATIPHFYFTTADGVFLSESQLPGADPATLRTLDWDKGLFADATTVFARNVPLKGLLDGASARMLPEKEMFPRIYIADNNAVYVLRNSLFIFNADDFTHISDDIAHFTAFAENPLYAKDSAYAYYQGRIIEEADTNTFTVAPKAPDYAYDNRFLYFKNKPIARTTEGTLPPPALTSLLAQENSSTLPVRSTATDTAARADRQNNTMGNANEVQSSIGNTNGVRNLTGTQNEEVPKLHGEKPLPAIGPSLHLPLVAPEKLRALNDAYATDGAHVFYYAEYIETLDAPTFTLLYPEIGFTRDKNGVYRHNVMLPTRHPDQFLPADSALNPFGSDSRSLWVNATKKIPFEGPVRTFSGSTTSRWILGNDSAFYIQSVTPAAESISLNEGGSLYIDAQHPNSLVFTEVDAASFAPISWILPENSSMVTPYYLHTDRYAKDTRQVYFMGQPVPDVDPATFTQLPLVEEHVPLQLCGCVPLEGMHSQFANRNALGREGGFGLALAGNYLFVNTTPMVEFAGTPRQLWPISATPSSTFVFVDDEKAIFVAHHPGHVKVTTQTVDISTFSVLREVSPVEVISQDATTFYYNDRPLTGLTAEAIQFVTLPVMSMSEYLDYKLSLPNVETPPLALHTPDKAETQAQTNSTSSEENTVPGQDEYTATRGLAEFTHYTETTVAQQVADERTMTCAILDNGLLATGYGRLAAYNSQTGEVIPLGLNGFSEITPTVIKDQHALLFFDGRFHTRLSYDSSVVWEGDTPMVEENPWSLMGIEM